MKKYSLGALVAAGLLVGGLSAGSASAADLGGNCCADLEERIAELEATTARKGNRKVSLTISGWVAEQVMWWDDGEEQNVYVGGIGTTLASHFKMTGQATISPGWYAGYTIHVETISNEPLAWNQTTPDAVFGFVNMLQSFWFVKSDHLGKFSVGKQSQVSDNTAILVDGSGSLVPANWVLFDNAGFFLRQQNGALSALTWGSLGFCHQAGIGIGGDCNGVPENVVRYDSPTWGGFSVGASWGEDDMWDVAARYAGEWNGIKVAAAAAYSVSTDENIVGGFDIFRRSDISLIDPTIPSGILALQTESFGKRDTSYFQVGAYVEHVPTGVFAYGAYGREGVDDTYFTEASAVLFNSAVFPLTFLATSGLLVPEDNPDQWYLKAGLRERWSPFGHTVLYAEYARYNDQISPGAVLATAADSFVANLGTAPGTFTTITGSEINQWGVGVVQEIDAAAMSVWLSFKHFEGSIDTQGCAVDLAGASPGNTNFTCNGATGSQDFEDFQLLKFGALINF